MAAVVLELTDCVISPASVKEALTNLRELVQEGFTVVDSKMTSNSCLIDLTKDHTHWVIDFAVPRDFNLLLFLASV
jgi:hypothetical protein